jgi:molybdate transport system substrate-binding protein
VDKKPIVAAALGAASLLNVAAMANAAEVKVLASNALKEAYLELVPAFERTTEHKVATTWAGTNDIMKRMAAGETYDLVIMAGPAIDELIKQGKVVAGSRVDLAKSGVGIAVRAGAPKPDISSGDAVKRALLAAKSIAHSSGPSGVYLAELFQRMGIADEIKPKIKQTTPGLPVGEVVAPRSASSRSASFSPSPASTISGRCRRTSSTSPCSPAASTPAPRRRTRPRRWSSSSRRRRPCR